ncbi:hypothetical protein QP999_09300 [Corynebacterium sp. MSK004]|uniref:hypothetical protein n=1 Tax=Corynebacterium sp. MSK004 TaxID=3050186 RepID=UPI00254FBB2E|nr:hypothetical protein [Corynebacterium sp. MSK004]MDK8898129.1 hypothetical protein [Corynebacterium sp. MSK004]
MSHTDTTWLCVSKIGDRFNPKNMVILSEHPTLGQARGTAPIHAMSGTPDVRIVRRETTYTAMHYSGEKEG